MMKEQEPSKKPPLTDATQVSIILKQAEQEEKEIIALHCRDIHLSDLRFSGLRIRKATFENCTFENCRFPQLDVSDTVFRACDLSGSDWREGYFERVTFTDCKAMGTSFAESRFKRCSIENGNFQFAGFDLASMRDCKIISSNFTHSVLTECALRSIVLLDTDFTQTSFFQTPLRGVHLTHCRIDGISLSNTNDELRGAVVSASQALMLASRLGIVIDENA